MEGTKAEVLAELQRQILPLQGFKTVKAVEAGSIDLGALNYAFPENCFPLGAVHEFIYKEEEGFAASTGFIAVILGYLLKQSGIVICIGMQRKLFPPAFKMFGVEPDNLIFIEVNKSKEVLWVMEEVLKCQGIAAVIGVTEQPGLTISRRWQLAVERSRVTAFILSVEKKQAINNSFISRWHISSLPSINEDDLPGVGNLQWKIELIKIRNGKPGTWIMQWNGKRLTTVRDEVVEPMIWKRKTG